MELRVIRESILDDAKKAVCGDREMDYGSPEDNFNVIAGLWTEYLNGDNNGTRAMLNITAKDVACMMALLKIARIKTGEPKADNWVDLAGYAACGGEIDVR